MKLENQVCTPEQWEEAFRQLAEYEKEVYEHNTSLLKKLCASALKNFSDLVDGCRINQKIEIVDKPFGQLQKGEKFGVFRKVYVDQWSVGDSGDSYAGFIYTNYGKSSKWLKIPYEC